MAHPVAPTDSEPVRGIDRRSVLGVVAIAALAAACESADDVGSSTISPDLAVDPGITRVPQSLPFYVENNHDDANNGGTTATTRPPRRPKPDTGQVSTSTSTTSGTGRPPTNATTPISSPKNTIKPGPVTTTKPATTTTSAATATTAISLPGLGHSAPRPPTNPVIPTTTPPPTTPPTDAPPPPAAAALLVANRLTFGVTPEIQAAMDNLGVSGWIEQQLEWGFAEPATEARLSGFRTLAASRQQAYNIARETNDPVTEELVHSNVIRARYSQHQLFEMMAHFWMDHFNIRIDDGNWRHLHIDYQENVIRPNAMGRFEDLLMATAESPAMLYYLDNVRSNANSSRGVNENYGRELLELHTLGIDPAGNKIYTEQDVSAAAHIMSGWSAVTDRNASDFSDFVYRSNYHWTPTVTVLGGGFSSAGRSEKAAGNGLIGYLAHHPTTARHIAYKLIRRFVTDTPPEALIASTAAIYLANDTALAPTLRHIFRSAAFADSEGMKLRRPFELVIASLRSLGSVVPEGPLTDAASTLYSRLRDLNHVPWRWEQPDGYADDADSWLSADGLLERWAFTSRLANNFFGNQTDPDVISSDLLALRGSATTVGQLIDELQQRFGLPGLTLAQRAAIVTTLQTSEGASAPSLDVDELGELASFLLAHPQYQVR